MSVDRRAALVDYLAMRRALGYRLARPEKLLIQLLDYLDEAGADMLTVEHALSWARLPAGGDVNWWAHRLSVVRGFARYLATRDPATEIPPSDLLPCRPRRASPYLYSNENVQALMAAAATLPRPLRRATFGTLIGLLATTGMRVGEAIALDRDDLDLTGRMITVRHGKFDKARLLPVHPTTTRALADYLLLRDRLASATGTTAVFVSLAGTRLLYCNVHATWKRLVAHAGMRPRSGGCRPRIHDLRHSFAVRSMLDAYTAGEDGQSRLSLISTYLGHVDPAHTYWYLSASPELLAAAASRLDAHLAGQR